MWVEYNKYVRMLKKFYACLKSLHLFILPGDAFSNLIPGESPKDWTWKHNISIMFSATHLDTQQIWGQIAA